MLRHGLCLALVLLAGCRTSLQGPMPASANALPMLAPATLGETRQVEQFLSGEFGAEVFHLRAVVTVAADKISMVGINALGMRVFSLVYDGQELHEQRQSQVPQQIEAVRLLNDLQLAFWPLGTLQTVWREAGVSVVEPYAGTRRLVRDGQLVAEVHYPATPWQGRVWIRHADVPYSLMIDSKALIP